MRSIRPHVLVVDDLPDNRNLLVQLLEDDHRVSQAADGREALAAIAADRPDLVLLDLAMPVLDGFGVLEALHREGGPFLPVLVVTAASEREARLRALQLGAHEFLTKPIDAEELLVRVKTLLSLKAARDELEARVASRTREVAWEQALNERLFGHVPAGVAFLDRDRIYRRANPARLQLEGGAPLEGQPLVGRYGAAGTAMAEAAARVLATGTAETLPTLPLGMRDDGEPIVWNVGYCVLPDADGVPIGVIELSQDVSEQAARERLQQAEIERLEELDRYKDEFLSVVSHELRTPLNFIMAFASILDDEVEGPLNAAQHLSLGKISQGADRMLVLVDDLLEFARIRTGKFRLEPELVEYAPLVAATLESLRPLAERKRLALRFEPGPLPQARIDGQRVVQVLTNLVGNAIKFTPEGGAITVRARLEGASILTEVADTGVGVAPADMALIFEPFRQVDMGLTRQAGGTGLGLAICQAIVEAHGGTLGVASALGVGSTFTFTLPLTAAAVSSHW